MIKHKMSNNPLFDKDRWKKKAMAFVTRSHRHLWGKNNEDPQVFLYTRGLKNQFVKDLLIGWNKYGQVRPAQSWGQNQGVEIDCNAEVKLFLPSGIVIPFIVKNELRSVFIHSLSENKREGTTILPGSLDPTVIFGEKKEKIVVIQDFFDGLFLFQETKETCCVMIHPDPDRLLDNHYNSMVKNAGTILIFSSDKTESDQNRILFPDVPDHCFYPYQSKEEVKERCLMH